MIGMVYIGMVYIGMVYIGMDCMPILEPAWLQGLETTEVVQALYRAVRQDFWGTYVPNSVLAQSQLAMQFSDPKLMLDRLVPILRLTHANTIGSAQGYPDPSRDVTDLLAEGMPMVMETCDLIQPFMFIISRTSITSACSLREHRH